MSARLRLVAEDGKRLCGNRKAARLAANPHAALARAAHDLEILRREAEAVAGAAAQMQETVRSFMRAVRDGDPLVVRAMALATNEMAAMVSARAINLDDMIARCAPGGAA